MGMGGLVQAGGNWGDVFLVLLLFNKTFFCSLLTSLRMSLPKAALVAAQPLTVFVEGRFLLL